MTTHTIAIGAPASAIKNFKEFKAQILDITGIHVGARNCELRFQATELGAKGILNAITNTFQNFGATPGSMRLRGKAYAFILPCD